MAKFTTTNCVYTATSNQKIDLFGPALLSHSGYKPPRFRFPGGSLKLISGTILVFGNGKVVLHAKTTDRLLESIVVYESLTGHTLSMAHLQNIAGKVNFGCSVDLPILRAVADGAFYNPELHPGVFVRFENVSLIIYHTGVGIFTGCRNEGHFEEVCRAIDELLNVYKEHLNHRDEFYRNNYW